MNLKGRPSAYRPDLYPTLASYWAQDGLTEAQMAERIGVAMSTFSLWKTKYPEFSEALKTTKDEADSKVVESLYHQALKGNVTAQIFWLTVWRDGKRPSFSPPRPSDSERLVSYTPPQHYLRLVLHRWSLAAIWRRSSVN